MKDNKCYTHPILVNKILNSCYLEDYEKEMVKQAFWREPTANQYQDYCPNCRKRIFIDCNHIEYDKDFEITEYSGECPYCKTEITWNDCYWR